MKIISNAKINLHLDVQGKTMNGFHSLETIIAPLALCDYLYITRIPDSDLINIETNNTAIPSDEKNIIFKCIQLFKLHFNISCGFNIYLEKYIPTRSGLGGESANAASMMHYFNTEFSLELSYADIFYYGRLLSWDVPICYFNKYIYINDKNSICEIIDCNQDYLVLLVMPNYGISTSDAFAQFDNQTMPTHSGKDLCIALTQNYINIGDYIYNCFIHANPRLLSDYENLKKYCRELGFDGLSLTGTGSCFFLISKEEQIIKKGYDVLSKKYPFVYSTNIIAKPTPVNNMFIDTTSL